MQKKGRKNSAELKSATTVRKNLNWIRLALVFFVFILYGNTLKHQFTLDDDIFYLKHKSVQKGVSALPELFSHGSMEMFNGTKGEQPYRPITLLSFALEKNLFNNNPEQSHFINVLLYVLILLVLFNLLLSIFRNLHPLAIALVVFLFAAHPVHTEVVASIKSRDELLAALFGLLAWLRLSPKEGQQTVPSKSLITGLFFFALALFSKESIITLALLIPLSNYLLQTKNFDAIRPQVIGLLSLAGLFILLRSLVIGSETQAGTIPVHENILAMAKGTGEQLATRMGILFYYLKLLVVPWPLTWDYSFNQIPVMNWTQVLPWLSLVAYSGLLIIALLTIKKKPALSFAILFLLISLLPVSNLFFRNLSTLGERFLFLPSLGFIIALSILLADIFKLDLKNLHGKGKNIFLSSSLVLIVLYSGLTISRAAEWKSNLSLFESGVIHSQNSSRAHYSLATEYTRISAAASDPKSRMEYLKKSILHFNRSLEIQPGNVQSLYNLANTQCVLGDTLTALGNYKKAIKLAPDHMGVLNNLGGIYVRYGDYENALKYLKQGLSYNPNDITLMGNIASVSYFAKNYPQAIEYAEKVRQTEPLNTKCLKTLIDAYNALGQPQEAMKYRKMLEGVVK